MVQHARRTRMDGVAPFAPRISNPGPKLMQGKEDSVIFVLISRTNFPGFECSVTPGVTTAQLRGSPWVSGKPSPLVCGTWIGSPGLASSARVWSATPTYKQLGGFRDLNAAKQPCRTFSRNFVRVLCATVQDFSAATIHLNPGKGLKTNKRDSGI